MASRSSYSGSGSRSTGRPTEDEGDDKPSFCMQRPVDNLSALRLNTPQAEEGPGQAEAAAGVAVLPQRSVRPVSKRSAANAPTPTDGPVVGYSEDGPIYASAGQSFSPSETLVTPPRPASNQASYTPRPGAASSTYAARRLAENNYEGTVNVAAGVPAAGTTDIESSEAPVSAEDEAPSSTGIPRKYKIGGAFLVVVVVALVVVIAVVVSNNNKDSAPRAPPVASEGESEPTSTPPPDASAPVEPTNTLSKIAQRGSLKCGIALQPGFGIVSSGNFTDFDGDNVSTGIASSGDYTGFDADLVSILNDDCSEVLVNASH